MSWSILLPDRPSKNAMAPATITINAAVGRFEQRMLLTIRPAALEGLPKWCRLDASVSVERGAAEHAGRYRISPGGPWRLRRSAGRTGSLSLKLPPPYGAPREGCRQIGVEIQLLPDMLEVVLPRLEAGSGSDKAPPAATPRMVPRQPYVGISERVPDPAKAIQAANGARVR